MTYAPVISVDWLSLVLAIVYLVAHVVAGGAMAYILFDLFTDNRLL